MALALRKRRGREAAAAANNKAGDNATTTTTISTNGVGSSGQVDSETNTAQAAAARALQIEEGDELKPLTVEGLGAYKKGESTTGGEGERGRGVDKDGNRRCESKVSILLMEKRKMPGTFCFNLI
jgi:hypothetical protein